MSEHLHSFRTIAGKYYCTHPKCFRKLALEDIEGKLVKCNKCEAQFIFVSANYTPKTLQINCNKCDNRQPWELTLDTQRKLLGTVLMDELLASQDKKEKYFRDFQTKIRNMQTDLADYMMKIEKQKQIVLNLQERTRNQRNHLALLYKSKRLGLKNKTLTAKISQPVSESAGDLMLSELEKLLKGET